MRPVLKAKAFTLIELLMVVGIVAILAALIFPIYKTMLERGHAARCSSNLRQLYFATMNYAQTHNNQLPYSTSFESQDQLTKLWSMTAGWVTWFAYPVNYISATPPPLNTTTGVKCDFVRGPRGLTCIMYGTLIGAYTGLTTNEMMNKRTIYMCPTFSQKVTLATNYVTRSYSMNRDASGANMFGITSAANLPLFCDLTNALIGTASMTNTPQFTNINFISRIHSGKRGNVVYLDGHNGSIY